MALFTAQIKTIKGEALAAKALGGQSMEFTRIGMGDGQLSGQSPAELEGLLGEKVSLPVAESYREDNSTWTVGAPFDNKDLSIGFYWREVGVYALDPDEGEILFSYASAQDAPDYIPPLTGGRWEKRIYVSEKVGSAANVTVDASKSVLYAPKEDLLAHVSDLGNPHQVTAGQVGAATPEWVEGSIAAHNGEGEAHPAIQVLLADLESRLATLELKYGTNVTGNPFSVGFDALTGLEVAGVWNQPYARVEF